MRVVIAAVGRPKDGAVAAAIRDYETRAARYWPLVVAEVRAERGESAELVVAREGERLLERVRGITTVVACDPRGKAMSSERFAEWLQGEREAARDVAFVLGGAFGLDERMRERSAMSLSFGAWTLPHELARLMLAEQLYRAGTIVRGEPYHK